MVNIFVEFVCDNHNSLCYFIIYNFTAKLYMIKNFTIYGERCSGTNYLEQLMLMNFDIKLTWKYGHKHFFGFSNLSNSDDTLFIGIVRNPYKWINSLYREKHHLPSSLFDSFDSFLNNEFWSHNDAGHELMGDRHIYTKKRYKNIFEMRYTKMKFLSEDMPKKVKNYIFIRYEDLLTNFDVIMNKIKNKGLKVKENIQFPLNTDKYKNTNMKFKSDSKTDHIPKDTIFNNKNFNLMYEKKFGYKKIDM